MPSTEVFDRYRSALMGLAYRMLGSVMDAEDIVQEAFLHWQHAPKGVRSPKTYLMTMVSRLCIDYLRLARVQREQYVGDWLPEPLIQGQDPAGGIDRAESLSTAFLLLLERLEPLDRAILLLHEVFGYSYSEIGSMVGRNAADCRQIGHRAHTKLAAERTRFKTNVAQVEQLTQQFIRAYSEGDLSGLLSLLAEDVTLWSDGGGKVKAALNPIFGVAKVTRFFLGIRRKPSADVVHELVWLNGQPAMVDFDHEQAIRVNTFAWEAGRIKHIYRVLNPDKLSRIPPLSARNPENAGIRLAR